MSSFYYVQHIYWREPLWLLLALQPLLVFLIKNLFTNINLSTYADKPLQPWLVFSSGFKFKRIILSKNTAYILAWLLLATSLAGPRIPQSQADKAHLFGANIMLVVDLSRSMKAIDVSPNRLLRAKIEIHELLEKSRDHRVGITVFSARPHLYVPLTSDHNVLRTYLGALNRLRFPTRGSDPVAALVLAQQELLKSKGKSAIVLLTDGDFPNIDKSQLDKLKKSNIPVYILGIGTLEGEAIQKADGTWLKHEQLDVVSRMNEKGLEKLSSHLNGKYSPVYDDDSDWKTLYEQGIAGHNAISNIKPNQRIIWKELFPYTLFPAILLFFISLTPYKINIIKNSAPLFLIFFFLNLLPNQNAYAYGINITIGQTIEQAAYRAHINKNYDKATKIYQTISNYTGHFGQGNSLYRQGHYQKAIPQFVSAVLSAQTDKHRADALYNLANSYFRTGQFSLAIQHYEDVLRYQPKNKACVHNIEVSNVLNKEIEKRIRLREEIISSSRQGQGPRSASVAEGAEISENTSVSMDGSENQLNDDIPLPDLPSMSESVITKLLLSGIENVKLAEQGIIKGKNAEEDNINNVNLLNAQQKLHIISDNQYILWKRLFEIEEGFPAPVEEPKIIPGVNPW